MSKRTSLGMVLALSLFLAGPARAVPITFAFTGTVTGVRDDGPYLDGSIGAGMGFSGTYTFESSTPDDRPEQFWGQYTFASSPELVMTLSIGNYAIIAPLQFISVNNGAKDGYQVMSGPFFVGIKEAHMNFSYTDETGSIFESDSLPTVAPDITRFHGFGGFDFGSTDQFGDSFAIGGEITSITPEPQSAALLMIGALAWCMGRKKR